jgi:hypothetical protein
VQSESAFRRSIPVHPYFEGFKDPAFRYYDDSLYSKATYHIVSRDLQQALVRVLPPDIWEWQDGLIVVTRAKLLAHVEVVHNVAISSMFDFRKQLNREIELLLGAAVENWQSQSADLIASVSLSCALSAYLYSGGSHDYTTTLPWTVEVTSSTAEFKHKVPLADYKLTRDSCCQDDRFSRFSCSVRCPFSHIECPKLRRSELQVFKDLENARVLCEREKALQSRVQQAALKNKPQNMVVMRNIVCVMREWCSSSKGQLGISTNTVLRTMISNDRDIWRRAIRFTKRVLNGSLAEDGLTGQDAISLVFLADIMRFVPGLEMYRFCSSQEYVQSRPKFHLLTLFPRFEADLPRYAQMVKPQGRYVFDRFVWFMYGVTIGDVSFEITQNMLHFRDLFKQFASETGGSSVLDGEISSLDQVNPDVWPDDSISTDHLELPPEVIWKPGEMDMRSLSLLLAATLIFGLMLAFLLGPLPHSSPFCSSSVD